MAKKAWISISDQDYRNQTEQIIWDSSSSDEDTISSPPPWKRPKPVQSPVISVSVQCSFKTSESVTPFDSPVIRLRYIDLNHISPEIPTHKRNDLSPVIERHRFKTVRKQKRQRIKQNLFSDQNSVDGSTTSLTTSTSTSCSSGATSTALNDLQLSQKIECTPADLIPANSQTEIKIEPFQSQFGTVVDDGDSSGKSWGVGLNFEPKKKRKKYKKGTLAYQLHKTVQLKKSRTKIWNHERLKQRQIICTNQSGVIRFKCMGFHKQYGVELLECENNDATKFIVCLGASQILRLKYEIGFYYELYPPYNIDKVVYDEESLAYYYNISKIAKCECSF